jgi:transposase
MTTKIMRLDHTVSDLRASARDADGKTAGRLLALAFVLEGCTRAEVARRCGMDRQTLRDWVIRYNDQGLTGLSDRPHGGGTPAKLTEEEKAQLASWVRQGPDLAEDGLVRWRLSDLRQRLFDRTIGCS